tara:strand:+ start:563 stop:1414 length:852 start_codon:yes stop_codon:yes gene_type:complete
VVKGWLRVAQEGGAGEKEGSDDWTIPDVAHWAVALDEVPAELPGAVSYLPVSRCEDALRQLLQDLRQFATAGAEGRRARLLSEPRLRVLLAELAIDWEQLQALVNDMPSLSFFEEPTFEGDSLKVLWHDSALGQLNQSESPADELAQGVCVTLSADPGQPWTLHFECGGLRVRESNSRLSNRVGKLLAEFALGGGLTRRSYAHSRASEAQGALNAELRALHAVGAGVPPGLEARTCRLPDAEGPKAGYRLEGVRLQADQGLEAAYEASLRLEQQRGTKKRLGA